MVLPTLVENAIKHGLSPLPQGGNIDIHARRAGEDLIVEVHDNGIGFSSSTGSGVGSGQHALTTGCAVWGRARMSSPPASPRGVMASIRLPMEWDRRRRHERRSDGSSSGTSCASAGCLVVRSVA